MLSSFLKTEISKTIGSDVRLKRFTLAFNRSLNCGGIPLDWSDQYSNEDF